MASSAGFIALVEEDAINYIKVLQVPQRCDTINLQTMQILIQAAEKAQLSQYLDTILDKLSENGSTSGNQCAVISKIVDTVSTSTKAARNQYLRELLEEDLKSKTTNMDTVINNCMKQVVELSTYYSNHIQKQSPQNKKLMGRLHESMIELPFLGVEKMYMTKIVIELQNEKKSIDEDTSLRSEQNAQLKYMRQTALLTKLYYHRAEFFGICTNMRIIQWCMSGLLALLAMQRAMASLVALRKRRPKDVDEIDRIVEMPWKYIDPPAYKQGQQFRFKDDSMGYLFRSPQKLVDKMQRVFAESEKYMQQLQLAILNIKIEESKLKEAKMELLKTGEAPTTDKSDSSAAEMAKRGPVVFPVDVSMPLRLEGSNHFEGNLPVPWPTNLISLV